jgi:hypothetical protein
MRSHTHTLNPRRARRAVLPIILGAALSAAVAVAGCGGGGDSAVGGTDSSGGAVQGTIPQPRVEGLTVAPASERVDLASPTFSDPTNITNPLFPVSKQRSVLLLGRVDGQPFRTEVTLLPETRIIEWQGRRVEALVSQYVAHLGGRLTEVAYDFYAQDDTGAVWYFGEGVFNFKDGAIANTHGTWIAGKDGPAAMIMPADPKVGDVYRPENIPGFVFEEVTVKAVGQTLAGPLGRVGGGLVIEELHMDGGTEAKAFAPGYGEFLTAGGGDVEALALAVPTDAVSEPAPAELGALESGAAGVFDAAQSGDWKAARSAVKKMTAAGAAVRAEAPSRLEPQLDGALQRLARAVDSRTTPEARQSAIEVARWSLDLQLRHRAAVEIDLARFDLWAAQLLVDAAAGDAAAINGDYFALDYVRDRIQHALGESERTRLNAELEELGVAVADGNLEAVANGAGQLRKAVAGFTLAG